MTSMYGAASSLMAILVWVYYSALIFFLELSSRMCMRISMAHAVLHNHGLANPVDFHNTRRLLLVSRLAFGSMTRPR